MCPLPIPSFQFSASASRFSRKFPDLKKRGNIYNNSTNISVAYDGSHLDPCAHLTSLPVEGAEIKPGKHSDTWYCTLYRNKAVAFGQRPRPLYKYGHYTRTETYVRSGMANCCWVPVFLRPAPIPPLFPPVLLVSLPIPPLCPPVLVVSLCPPVPLVSLLIPPRVLRCPWCLLDPTVV